jgi:hypothetical protein
VAGAKNSSLTRVQPLFDAAFALDPTGDRWLSALLKAMPRSSTVLGELVDEPGDLIQTLLGPHPSGKAPRACYEYDVAAPKSLLRWFVEHPQHLTWPKGSDFGRGTEKWRRALLYDEAPGREAATAEALRLIEVRNPLTRGWWRFEGASSIDCVIGTDRLVICVEGKRTEPLSSSTDWYPPRTQIVRNLEAARQIARGRRWASVVISADHLPDAGFKPVAASLDEAAPHLSDVGRGELQAAYLGNITWQQACTAIGVPFASLPDTVA